jgi:bacterioferritin-associated ferredoxin
MIVCLCHRISDRDIAQAVRDGVRDFDTLQDDTCIARNCGCCESSAREVFEQACAAKPQAPVVTPQPVHFHRPQAATIRPRHSLVIG